jgi:pre-rRNA-processing protein IPI1
MYNTLISTFLDCAPTVFSLREAPPENGVSLVIAVGEIARSLYGCILQGPATVHFKLSYK